MSEEKKSFGESLGLTPERNNELKAIGEEVLEKAEGVIDVQSGKVSQSSLLKAMHESLNEYALTQIEREMIVFKITRFIYSGLLE